jgi:serine kinase of HPr protein (carbohydrate metabolism regulator)
VPPETTGPSEVLLIGGRSGVGKSSAALALHELLARRDVEHALIEGDDLDLAHPAPWRAHPSARLAERNLAAIWSNYRELGYRRLVFTNTVSVVRVGELVTAIGGEVSVTSVLLRCSDQNAAERLGRRERGESLRAHLERSVAAAAMLDAGVAPDVARLDTDGRTPEQIAEELARLAEWV